MLHRVPEVTADDGAVLGALDEIRRDLRHALARPRGWEGTLRRQARARAVRGSNSIEGIRVSGDEAFAIVGGEEDQVSVDETWLAVKGYSDAMIYLQIVAERSGPPLDARDCGVQRGAARAPAPAGRAQRATSSAA